MIKQFNVAVYSISMSSDGTIVALGVPFSSAVLPSAGFTQIYKLNNGSWEIMGNTIHGNENDRSGFSVSLSSNGTIIAIGGSYTNNSNRGTTRVYQFNSNTSYWDIIGDPINGLINNERSGYSVSLSSDGTTVAIGSPFANSSTGTVRIYQLTNTVWNILGDPINGVNANEYNGDSVSLSSDGTTVAIGAYGANSNSGSARIYKWNNTTRSWGIIGDPINGTANEKNGDRVSLSSDGTTVAIVATGSGLTRMYNLNNGSWSVMGNPVNGSTTNGGVLSLSSDGTTVATTTSDVTNIMIYKWNGTHWNIMGNTIVAETGTGNIILSSNGKTLATSSFFRALCRIYNYI
jgi:hypothetical protein